MYTVKFLKDSGAHKAGDIGELEKAVYKQLLAEGAVKEIDPNAPPEAVIAQVSEAPFIAPGLKDGGFVLEKAIPEPVVIKPVKKPAKK